jgi:hypothetical protein
MAQWRCSLGCVYRQVGGSAVGRADTVNPELQALDEELAAAYDAVRLR